VFNQRFSEVCCRRIELAFPSSVPSITRSTVRAGLGGRRLLPAQPSSAKHHHAVPLAAERQQQIHARLSRKVFRPAIAPGNVSASAAPSRCSGSFGTQGSLHAILTRAAEMISVATHPYFMVTPLSRTTPPAALNLVRAVSPASTDDSSTRL